MFALRALNLLLNCYVGIMTTYSKDIVALHQLEKAISLFFEEDYICAITLAGAAEDICKGILERESKETSVDKLKAWFKDKYPEAPELEKFYFHANKTRNSLKHFNDTTESSVEIDKEEAVYWLNRAVMNYDWSHAILTKPIIQHIDWMNNKLKNENL